MDEDQRIRRPRRARVPTTRSRPTDTPVRSTTVWSAIFYGYGSVVEEHRDTLAFNTIYRSVAREFQNDSYYTKGLLKREVLQDASGDRSPRRKTPTSCATSRTQQPIADAQSTIATAFPQLTRTDRRFYEGLLSPTKTTFTTHTYDTFGNIATFTDAGEVGAQMTLLATITYTNCQPAYIIKANHIDVRGNGAVMRLRDADIDCTTGNLRQVRQSLTDGHDGADRSHVLPERQPADSDGAREQGRQRYALTYQYDATVATHVSRITDSFGLSSQATYDFSFGKVVTTTDTNNNVTTNAYDSVGRLQTIYGPYEQSQTVATLSFSFAPVQTPYYSPSGSLTLLTDVPYAITRHVDKDADGKLQEHGHDRHHPPGGRPERVIQTKKDSTVLEDASAPQDRMRRFGAG